MCIRDRNIGIYSYTYAIVSSVVMFGALGTATYGQKEIASAGEKMCIRDRYVEEDEKFGDIAPYDVGPEEFLNWIRGAKYVCTDSFHGTCFSIIHHKKFIDVYKRQAVSTE